MCVILDANCIGDFNDSANEDMKPVRQWLERKNSKIVEGFRLDNDVLAICPNAAATPLLSFYKYNRFTKNC